MHLPKLKFGYYVNYHSGDGSMFDHCTAYEGAKKYYTIFDEDDEHYYDILDDNKPYKKDASYGESLVTIKGDLLDIMPFCIDSEKDYTLNEILSFMPRRFITHLSQKNVTEYKKALL